MLGAIAYQLFFPQPLEAQGNISRAFRPGGVLAVWSYSQSHEFADALADVFGEVQIEPVIFENPLVDTVRADILYLVRDRV